MEKIKWLLVMDEDLKRKVKSQCALQNIKLSSAVEIALLEWLERVEGDNKNE